MADYRIYLIDETGHIRRVKEVEAASDEAATAAAREFAAGERFEIWNRARLVAGEDAVRREA
jgi:hypothetical protein